MMEINYSASMTVSICQLMLLPLYRYDSRGHSLQIVRWVSRTCTLWLCLPFNKIIKNLLKWIQIDRAAFTFFKFEMKWFDWLEMYFTAQVKIMIHVNNIFLSLLRQCYELSEKDGFNLFTSNSSFLFGWQIRNKQKS